MTATENCPFNEFTSSNHRGFYRTGPLCSSPDLQTFLSKIHQPREQEVGPGAQGDRPSTSLKLYQAELEEWGVVSGGGREGM